MKHYKDQRPAYEDGEPCRSWTRHAHRLEVLPGDEKTATEKLKQSYGKLGFVDMKSTPFMFRSMAWELPSVEHFVPEDIDDLRL